MVTTLSEEQLDTQYRPEGMDTTSGGTPLGGLALERLHPLQMGVDRRSAGDQTYQEALWAELVDYRDTPIEISLQFLQVLHARWVVLLRGLSEDQRRRKFQHPEWGAVDIRTTSGIYAWHGRHTSGPHNANHRTPRLDLIRAADASHTTKIIS